MTAPESRPAPSLVDVADALSTIQATRRGLGDNPFYPLLEAAETVSAAYHHAAQRDDTEAVDSDPPPAIKFEPEWIDRGMKDECPPHGIPRPGVFARRFTVVHVAAVAAVGGAIWVGLGWLVWTVVS